MALRPIGIIALVVVAAACASTASNSSEGAPSSPSARAERDITRLVEIGAGRQIRMECRGSGSPTVVLIPGKGTDATDWMQIVDPTDPALEAPGDDVGAGLAKQIPSDDAVFPSVARFTRVCSYDRPDTSLGDADASTPRPQPHTVASDVSDLHALLTEAGEQGPFILVPHSYAGWITELYAREYPTTVGGVVMVDAATHLLGEVMSPAQLAQWDTTNRVTSPQLREGVEVIDAIHRIDAADSMPEVPAIVLTADKAYRTDLLPAGTDPNGSLTFDAWLTSQDRLAAELGAKHLTNTASGHHVYLYAPELVVGAIREVVRDVRTHR